METELYLATKRPLEPPETGERLLEPEWRLPPGGRLRPGRVSHGTEWSSFGQTSLPLGTSLGHLVTGKKKPWACAGLLAKEYERGKRYSPLGDLEVGKAMSRSWSVWGVEGGGSSDLGGPEEGSPPGFRHHLS